MLRAFVMLLLFEAPPVVAQIVDTGRTGAWSTFETKERGQLEFCGLESRDGSRSVVLSSGDDDFFLISLFNSNWSFTQTAPVRVSIRLGREKFEQSGRARPGPQNRRPDSGSNLARVVLVFDWANSA